MVWVYGLCTCYGGFFFTVCRHLFNRGKHSNDKHTDICNMRKNPPTGLNSLKFWQVRGYYSSKATLSSSGGVV